jgi:hypothetical protein
MNQMVLRAFKPVLIGWVAWAALAGPQRPSYLESLAAIEKSRAVALDYARSLPDFMCTEVIERSADPRRIGRWLPADTLTVELRYVDRMEDHKLALIDGKPTEIQYESLGGAIGWGEFGAMLHDIFDPSSEAQFHWESWKNVRKHRAAVYSYVVEPSHSHYTLGFRVRDGWREGIVGFHGVVTIDGETGGVLHLSYDADHIPKSIGIEASSSSVDYDYAAVGGRDYLLPATADTVLESPQAWARNHAEFRGYRKFSSESTVDFGTAK